jgi:activator of HSP90 ATPase
MIKKTYSVDAPIKAVWDALVNPATIEKWTGAKAIMLPEKETEFSIWGGDIFGTNKEVIKEKRLVQEWYAGKWKKPSIVEIDLAKKGNKTIIGLTHDGYPEKEHESLDSGWDEYYFGEIKKLLER